jgi:hypothetical protein
VCVALFIQHVKRMHHIVFSSVVCPAPSHFSTLSHKCHNFRKKKKNWDIKHVFWFSLKMLCETFVILRRIWRCFIINAFRSSCNVNSILSGFNKPWIFSTDFRKLLFDSDWRTDGQTDGHDEANSCFSHFCERSQTLNEIKLMTTSYSLWIPEATGGNTPLQRVVHDNLRNYRAEQI